MRSASVDNRSRSIWLLAGLGVLIWAALSVFLGGSSAHADEPPAHPSHQSQQQVEPQKQPQKQARPQRAPQAVPQRAPQAAPQPQRKVSAAPRTVQRSGEAVQLASVKAMKSTAVQTTELDARPDARSLPPHAKRAAARIADHLQNARGRQAHVGHPGRGEDHAHDRSDRGARAHERHTDPHPAQPAAAAKHHAHGKHHAQGDAPADAHHRVNVQHSSPVASVPARTAPASAPVSAAVVASDDAPAHSHSPFDSRDTSTHQQPAAPPSVASSAAGTSASPGVLPGTADASDVLGPLLSAAHADDDILPSGPAGTTDNSPD